jgi:hypothetical protein
MAPASLTYHKPEAEQGNQAADGNAGLNIEDTGHTEHSLRLLFAKSSPRLRHQRHCTTTIETGRYTKANVVDLLQMLAR